jgi:hypothetical protein
MLRVGRGPAVAEREEAAAAGERVGEQVAAS